MKEGSLAHEVATSDWRVCRSRADGGGRRAGIPGVRMTNSKILSRLCNRKVRDPIAMETRADSKVPCGIAGDVDGLIVEGNLESFISRFSRETKSSRDVGITSLRRSAARLMVSPAAIESHDYKPDRVDSCRPPLLDHNYRVTSGKFRHVPS